MKKPIPISRIQRIESLEEEFGIEDVTLYAYVDGDTVVVAGEVLARSLTKDLAWAATAYNEEGEVIGVATRNEDYGSGVVNSWIKASCFDGIMPFKLTIEIPDGEEVAAVRVYPIG